MYPLSGGGQMVTQGTGRHLRLYSRMVGLARLHGRHRAVRVHLRELPQSALTGPGQPPPWIILEAIDASRAAFKFFRNRDRRARIIEAQMRSLGGGRSGQYADLHRLPVCLQIRRSTGTRRPDSLCTSGTVTTLTRYIFGNYLVPSRFSESISQAAQETERPPRSCLRTSVASFSQSWPCAISLSNLALGILPWQATIKFDRAPDSADTSPPAPAAGLRQAARKCAYDLVGAAPSTIGPFPQRLRSPYSVTLLLIYNLDCTAREPEDR